jgi:hypothetical protein
MKSLLEKIFFFLVFINIDVNAQEYHPLLNNSEWIVNVADFTINQDFTIENGIDVEIDSFVYKKFVDSFTNEELFLREDVLTRKVYKRINNIDVLFFDFSLQLSNTITLPSGDTYIVSSISTIIVNGGQRKKISLTNQTHLFDMNNETWIEGVGNINYPLKARYEYAADPTYTLKCSFQGENNIYNQGIAMNSTPTDCNRLSISENEFNNSILYSPNPFNSELTITTTKNLSNSSLKVYNSIGQPVKKVENVYGNKVILQRENLVSGIYFVQLFENDKMISSQKIIIKD